MDSFAAKVLKRQYVSSVERQWYQEIVRMAGAKRYAQRVSLRDGLAVSDAQGQHCTSNLHDSSYSKLLQAFRDAVCLLADVDSSPPSTCVKTVVVSKDAYHMIDKGLCRCLSWASHARFQCNNLVRSPEPCQESRQYQSYERFQSPSFGGFNPAFGPPGFPGLAGSMEPLPALGAPMQPMRMPGASSNLQGLGLELEPRRRGTLPELSAFEDSDSQEAGKTVEKAEDEATDAVQEAVKKDLDKAEDETDKMLDKDPDNTRVPQDTADAVQMYAQKRIVPTFTGGLTMRKINDLISESRQLLHKVHGKLNAMKVKPPDTGSAAAAEGASAKQAQKQQSSALQLMAIPPARGWRLSVRRLTTYGGASRWLKFQKRPSAAADLQGAGSSQQQLFLAWMQSMGRRQESIFQDAASKPPPPHRSGDADELSDSEDLDSLSEDSDSEDEEEPEPRQEGTSRPSRRSEHVHKPKDGHDSETDAADTPKMELQSHRGDRLGREERAMHRRGLGSKDEILGYARQVADEMGQSDGVSVSDIMMFAKRVAAHPSESGVVTESFGVDGFSNDMFSDNSLGGSALLRFARGVAQRGDLSSAGGTSAVEGDVLAFARKVAQQASESGIGTGITEGTDIMAFARKAARAVSQSGISQGASESDVLAFARKAAREISQSGVNANDSDILTFARKAADDVSKSGVVSETSVLAFARQVASGMHSEVTETSAATSRSDFLAFARRAAQDVSKSGVASSVASGAESDIYAFAQQVAGDVSRSGVHGASEAAGSVRESDIFAIAQRHTGLPESKTPANPASSVASGSDIMQFAQKVAQDVSEAGYSRASEASDSRLLESRSGAESTSDVLAFARSAAQAVGSSTVPSEDLFVPARRVLREGSSVSGSEPEVQSLHWPSHAYSTEPPSKDFGIPVR
ncbi:unnamed protein product [Symbiodinium necroappetens]|uniref:Uncharacterized protein n=1 Tax=Symbiodinium necroappetens TaxID=1628268 RepID=A0A812JS13_9DINO|nr:unnamed protein product [Symbiodinium necroappetens]